MSNVLNHITFYALIAAVSACGGPELTGVDEDAISAGGFRPAVVGCATSHCNVRMSDLVGIDAPPAGARELWRDNAAPGSSLGLGCVSNGRRAACTHVDGSVIVYDSSGNRLWKQSGFHPTLWKSAPMIDAAGGVIVTDRNYIVRFNPNGNAATWAGGWITARTEGGDPISPVMVGTKVILVATDGGPLATYDARNGNRLHTLDLGVDTINTPGVSLNNRAYVSTDDGQGNGALRAIDVNPNTGVMTDAWGTAGAFKFLSKSQASPLVIGNHIYFDGHLKNGTFIKRSYAFCVRDAGASAVPVWQHRMVGEVSASLARDPRGGVWVYGLGATSLIRLEEADADQDGMPGEVLQTLNLDALVAQPGVHGPASVMTIDAGPSFYTGARAPVMMVNAAARESTWVTAINLAQNASHVLWKVKVSDAFVQGTTAAQFPIVRDPSGRSVVIFTANNSGARGVGLP